MPATKPARKTVTRAAMKPKKPAKKPAFQKRGGQVKDPKAPAPPTPATRRPGPPPQKKAAEKATPRKRAPRKPTPPPEPAVDWETCPVSLTFAAVEFPTVVRNAQIGASSDVLRPPLTCVRFSIQPDGRWRAVTTDSYKIVVQDGPAVDPAAAVDRAAAPVWTRIADVGLLVMAARYVAPWLKPTPATDRRVPADPTAPESDRRHYEHFERVPAGPGAPVTITWPDPDHAYLAVGGDDSVRLALRGPLARGSTFPAVEGGILDGLALDAAIDVPKEGGDDAWLAARGARVAAVDRVRPVRVALNSKFLTELGRLRALSPPASMQRDGPRIDLAPDWTALKPVRFDVGDRVWGALMPVRVA